MVPGASATFEVNLGEAITSDNLIVFGGLTAGSGAYDWAVWGYRLATASSVFIFLNLPSSAPANAVIVLRFFAITW